MTALLCTILAAVLLLVLVVLLTRPYPPHDPYKGLGMLDQQDQGNRDTPWHVYAEFNAGWGWQFCLMREGQLVKRAGTFDTEREALQAGHAAIKGAT